VFLVIGHFLVGVAAGAWLLGLAFAGQAFGQQTPGIITTVAGNGTVGYNGDNIAATGAELYYPEGVGVDSAGNLYIADTYNHRVRKVDTSGNILVPASGAATSARDQRLIQLGVRFHF